MPTAQDFLVISCQFSIFTDEFQFQSAKALGVMLEKYSEVLDGDPQTIPSLPELQIPIEIPRLILRNSVGSLSVNISPARFDVVYNGDLQKESFREFREQALGMALRYTDRMSARVFRLAFILTRIANDENPAKSISTQFCKERWIEGPLNRPADFQLHVLKQFTLQDWIGVNSWFRCKVGESPASPITSGKGTPVILVEQDINTPADNKQNSFDPHNIAKFISSVPVEMDHIMTMYFPV